MSKNKRQKEGSGYFLPEIPRRQAISHKNTYGRFLVWATSPGVVGCGYFVCRAIYLSGGGYVKAIVPYENYSTLSILTPETVFFIYRNEIEKEEILKRELRNCDYFIGGPGIGVTSNNIALIKYIIANFSNPIIFDADALKLLVTSKEILKSSKSKNIIITPHEGEFSYISDIPLEYIRSNRERCATNFANTYNVICVLKGYKTVVTDGRRVYVNNTGGPHLAKAGTGDVLTGIIAGLLGLKLSPFDSACLGTYIHGSASDIVKKELGENSLIPDNLLNAIPFALKKYTGT